MILRQILWLVVVFTFGWLLRRLFRSGPQSSPRPPMRETPAPEQQGRMVRDRICNTFLPESRALTTDANGELHFFCSERCRQDFLQRG